MVDVNQYRQNVRINHMRVIILCFVGLIVNLVSSHITETLKLPIWLDTIGTIGVAVFGGALPAMVVGLFTNILRGAMDFNFVYFIIVNVLIAGAASYMTRKGAMKHIWSILLLALTMSLIGGFVGGALIHMLYYTSAEAFWINFGWNVVDKFISVGIVTVGYYLVPEKQRLSLRFYGWQQTPLSEKEVIETKNIKCRGLKLRTKLVLVLSISLLILAVVATAISFMLYRNSVFAEYTGYAQSVAALAAETIDGDAVDLYLEEGENVPGYSETMEDLKDILNTSRDIEYIYVYRIAEDGCHVVFDVDTPLVKGEKAGTVISFDPDFTEYLPKLLAGERIEPVVSDDQYGWLLTAYEPVYDSEGRCVCYAGADVAMHILSTGQLNFFGQMVFLFVGFVVLILSVVLWFVKFNIVYPINSLANRMEKFAYDTEEDREENVERIRRMDIHTGDEVEHLYTAFTKMMEDNMEHMEQLRQKTETIEQMQDAILTVLADLVENRDKNTGEHIRKTAAYVDIILRQMQKMGMYPDIITDEYIKTVVKSAPLHDIGKISVPDAVLCKPGKLDDYEYEIMKQHTTAGRDVIVKAIEQLPDAGYLNEAKNLVYYHHEKWNGKGYPEGIAGESIPLSARVMAVADVFDALASNRVYKKAFTVEISMQMIREESGSHFDPKVVDAFMAAGDQIIAVEYHFRKSAEEDGRGRLIHMNRKHQNDMKS